MLSDPQLHYLDNAATTQVDPAVTEAIHDALVELWANPSSLYDPAVAAQDGIDTARGRIAKPARPKAETDGSVSIIKNTRRFCNAKTAWFLHKQSHTERTPAVPDPPTCNSPASRRGALAPRLPPTFSGLRPMADFRHTAFAVSVHPCAHSAVRGGF